MLAAGWALAVFAQQTMDTPILIGAGGGQILDQRQDDRIGHRPVSREDPSMKSGRELLQGETVAQAAPPPKPAPDSPRVRARVLLLEDRSRVKREAALDD